MAFRCGSLGPATPGLGSRRFDDAHLASRPLCVLLAERRGPGVDLLRPGCWDLFGFGSARNSGATK